MNRTLGGPGLNHEGNDPGRPAPAPPVSTAASLGRPEEITLDLAPFTKKFEMAPSGGIPDRWCVRPTGDAHNVIKHVPYDVATALMSFLNGERRDAATEILATHILGKEGFLKPEDIAKIKQDWPPVSAPLPEVAPGPKGWDITMPACTVLVDGKRVVLPEREHHISPQMVGDLLVTAKEGGIGYWAEVRHYEAPKNGVPFMVSPDLGLYKFCDYPLNGGSVTLADVEGDEGPWTLDFASLERGLKVMAEKFPQHFYNIVQDNIDADTADAFVQCAVMGDIVFG